MSYRLQVFAFLVAAGVAGSVLAQTGSSAKSASPKEDAAKPSEGAAGKAKVRQAVDEKPVDKRPPPGSTKQPTSPEPVGCCQAGTCKC